MGGIRPRCVRCRRHVAESSSSSGSEMLWSPISSSSSSSWMAKIVRSSCGPKKTRTALILRLKSIHFASSGHMNPISMLAHSAASGAPAHNGTSASPPPSTLAHSRIPPPASSACAPLLHPRAALALSAARAVLALRHRRLSPPLRKVGAHGSPAVVHQLRAQRSPAREAV
ncbi:hypothetical protein B0H13DRAFT_2004984, partial [Mycena leptocephala]